MADDPETLRIRANTRIFSNVTYHGDLEKKAQMEKQRQINENGELVGKIQDNGHGDSFKAGLHHDGVEHVWNLVMVNIHIQI